MSEYPAEFRTSLSFVLSVEGGYSNDRSDPGGETNLGVTRRVYLRYCKLHELDAKSMRDLTLSDVEPIYFAEYWKPVCVGVGFPLCVAVFDCAVNMGPGRAKRYLLSSTGIHSYVDARWTRYLERATQHPPSVKFLLGWCNRLRKLLVFVGYPKHPRLESEYSRLRAEAAAKKALTQRVP